MPLWSRPTYCANPQADSEWEEDAEWMWMVLSEGATKEQLENVVHLVTLNPGMDKFGAEGGLSGIAQNVLMRVLQGHGIKPLSRERGGNFKELVSAPEVRSLIGRCDIPSGLAAVRELWNVAKS